MKKFFLARSLEKYQEQNKDRALLALLKTDEKQATDADSTRKVNGLIHKAFASIIASGDHIARGILPFPDKLEDMSETLQSFRMDIDRQNGLTQDLASIAEELDAAINSLVDNAGSLKVISETSLEKTKQVAETVETVDHIVENATEASLELRSRNDQFEGEFQQLQQHIRRVKEQTEQVTNIADRTNLLALNASIEAARAGQSGAGFAVVANGVSELAEKSKSVVKHINEAIDDMNARFENWLDDARSRIESMNHLLDTMLKIKGTVQQNSELAESMQQDLRSIVEAGEEMLASTEEVRTATETVSSSANNISQRATTMITSTKSIQDKMQEINESVIDSVNNVTNQNPVWLLAFIRARRKDHILWVRQVDAAIAARDVDLIPQLDHRLCNMGLWMRHASIESQEMQEIHSKLDEPHRCLHESARSIRSLIENEATDQAIRESRSVLENHYQRIAKIFDEYEIYLEHQVAGSL